MKTKIKIQNKTCKHAASMATKGSTPFLKPTSTKETKRGIQKETIDFWCFFIVWFFYLFFNCFILFFLLFFQLTEPWWEWLGAAATPTPETNSSTMEYAKDYWPSKGWAFEKPCRNYLRWHNSKLFWRQKILWRQSFFWKPKHFWRQTNFWRQQNFQRKNYFDLEKLLDVKQLFVIKTMLNVKSFFDVEKIFGRQKVAWRQNVFSSKCFFQNPSL